MLATFQFKVCHLLVCCNRLAVKRLERTLKNKCSGNKTDPSSLYTIAIEPKVVLYLISPATGCGPWIRLFATSNGILTQDAKVPDTKPMPTLRKNSCTGSCKQKSTRCILLEYNLHLISISNISVHLWHQIHTKHTIRGIFVCEKF